VITTIAIDTSRAYTWLFPLVMVVGILVSGYMVLTGNPVGFTLSKNPTYIRLMGGFGVIVAAALLVYWFLAIGPGPG
jgi:hypothetical protein